MQRCVSLSISGKAVTLNEKYFEDFYHMLILQKKCWSSLLAFPPSQCSIITSLFSVSMDLPILDIPTWGTHTMGDLCDWGLLSLSPVLEHMSALHSFLYCGLILFHGVAIVHLLIHPSVGVSLGYFHFFTIRNNTAAQTCGKLSWETDFSVLRYIPRNGFLGYLVTCWSLGELPPLLSIEFAPFYVLTVNRWVSQLLHILVNTRYCLRFSL